MIEFPEPTPYVVTRMYGNCSTDKSYYTAEQMREYAAACVSEERNACATECNEIAISYAIYAREGDNSGASDHKSDAASECVEAIRSRSAPEQEE